MTGPANQWLLIEVMPSGSRRIVAAMGADAEDSTIGYAWIEDVMDAAALADAPTEPGRYVWQGRIEDVAYPEVHPGIDGKFGPGLYAGADIDTHWDGRWAPATAEDVEAFGIAQP